MEAHLIHEELAEALTSGQINSEHVDELVKHYQEQANELVKHYQEQANVKQIEFDLHSQLIDEFLSLCPIVFNNCWFFFRYAMIMVPATATSSTVNVSNVPDEMRAALPDGYVVTTVVWLPYTNNVRFYADRQMIMYTEMVYLARKLNVTLMFVYKLFVFCDEYQGLTPLLLDVMLKIDADAHALAVVRGLPMTQVVFMGQNLQGIYAFMGGMLDAVDCIRNTFGIPLTNVFEKSGTWRVPESHAHCTL